MAGKVYEAWVLCDVLEHLVQDEGCTATLRGGRRLTLKSSPGPINRDYSWFELTRYGNRPLEVWTDVEFVTLSYERGGRQAFGRTHKHELDIVVIEPSLFLSQYPSHTHIKIGVECKNTGYTKAFLRGILGVRRELSLLQESTPTGFTQWPRQEVPANPPSCLVVYASQPSVLEYKPPIDVFGIDFVHYPMP